MDDPKGEELAAVIAEIRQRVRARVPNGVGPKDIPLPDLTPLLHARDAAEAKVASIGTVNPRRGGLKNSIIQRAKRMVARALDWHVREQVEFNRGVMAMRASHHRELNVCKQALSLLAGKMGRDAEELRGEARELKDIRAHWVEWRTGWEQKLANTEIQFSAQRLRTAGGISSSRHRGGARRSTPNSSIRWSCRPRKCSSRFWDELARVRLEYERMIHSELRVLRQRATLAQAAVARGVPERAAGVRECRLAEVRREVSRVGRGHSLAPANVCVAFSRARAGARSGLRTRRNDPDPSGRRHHRARHRFE